MLWDLARRRQLRSLDADGALALSPDGRTLAASRRQRGEILLIDPATGKRRRTLTGHTAGVLGLSFSHDGARLASTDQDGTAIIWDLATGRARETLGGHTAAVTGVAFSPDDRTLYTASWDRSAIVWDLARDRRLAHPVVAGTHTSSRSLAPAQSKTGAPCSPADTQRHGDTGRPHPPGHGGCAAAGPFRRRPGGRPQP